MRKSRAERAAERLRLLARRRKRSNAPVGFGQFFAEMEVTNAFDPEALCKASAEIFKRTRRERPVLIVTAEVDADTIAAMLGVDSVPVGELLTPEMVNGMCCGKTRLRTELAAMELTGKCPP